MLKQARFADHLDHVLAGEEIQRGLRETNRSHRRLGLLRDCSCHPLVQQTPAGQRGFLDVEVRAAGATRFPGFSRLST
jgi:hypothetical protein